MAEVPFKVISWTEFDLIDEDKMDALVTNDIWLRDNMARGQYQGHGVKRTEGIKIASGLALITARKQTNATQNIAFNGFFLSVCNPIVTTAIVSSHQRRVFCTIDGLGKLHPDSRGFQCHIQVESDKKIKRNMYVSWHAVGY